MEFAEYYYLKLEFLTSSYKMLYLKFFFFYFIKLLYLINLIIFRKNRASSFSPPNRIIELRSIRIFLSNRSFTFSLYLVEKMNRKTEKNSNKYENPLKIAVSTGSSTSEGTNEPKFEKKIEHMINNKINIMY